MEAEVAVFTSGHLSSGSHLVIKLEFHIPGAQGLGTPCSLSPGQHTLESEGGSLNSHARMTAIHRLPQ